MLGSLGEVVSFETNAQGRRRFVACTAEKLWRRMVALPVGARHFYEIIREGCACHLYLDIEFRRAANKGLDGSALVAFLTVRILTALQERFGIRAGLEDVIDLDSSTDAKFSRHLVVVLPGGQRFRDNQHVGRFVLLLVAALANEAATDALAAALWVRPEETDAAPPATEGAPAPAVAASMAGPGESTDRAKPGRAEESRTPLEGRTPIVDLGVYTRNRAMRLYMSRKYGKKASLMPASTNAFEDGWGRGGDRPAVAVPQTRPAAESPFPPVDAWVLQLAASFGGPPARIRSVAVLTRAVRLVSLDRNAGATSEAAAGEGDRAPSQGESAGAAGAAPTDAAGPDRREAALVRRLIYSMADNRFCLRIGRQHRSNNVAFSVDLEAGTASQTCMDPLCRGWRSDAVQVPVEVLPDQVPAGVCVEPVE
ncbi:hypothetical protein FNF29_05035 [Cafeteria roenbergensis]|uniref:DNA-directed primase/polymerase protein n=1 Tax=Cafeteria roenbergensis TaxID=33653 RepID=A0A5A8CCS4_CAFRO|nr:hypothetical protein FNF29_05035 [Cafeteria roenbergensis]|eukprot:KAA0150698.1 hypothetical protein FNF29_05035 [Cafeteria roenbergensis]